MALFCVISANSGSFRAHCVRVHVRYLISWWVLVLFASIPSTWRCVLVVTALVALTWVTVREYTVLVCNQPLRPTQPPTLNGMRNNYRLRAVSVNGKIIVGLAYRPMRHRLRGVSTYWFNGLTKGDEHPTYTLAVGVWHTTIPFFPSSLAYPYKRSYGSSAAL